VWITPTEEPRDPVEVALRLAGRPGLVFLDGNGDARRPGSPAQGRYSFVAADPVEARTARFGEPPPLPWPVEVDHHAERCARAPRTLPGGDATGPTSADVPRWVGFVGYDAALPALLGGALHHPRSTARPLARWARYRAVWALDHATGRAFLCGDDAEACDELLARIREGRPRPPEARVGAPSIEDPARHLRAIEAALEHIGRGDIYQVNLARRFAAPYAGSSLALFLAMRAASPVPFGFFAEADGLAVLGRSMERFLRWTGASGRLEARPIKGTAARPAHDRGDVALALRADEKERAEHAMIVDLMRNDLGRVAVPGTVEVAGLFEVEPYARLSHLVSTVRCVTRPEVTLPDVIGATFPPGSVTGAPKVRAVQIIEALERSPRGVYCGTYGHVDRAGGLHLAVAIRTATIADGVAEYHAGGGLVEASQPAKELAETELKARVFFDALARLSKG
jgi:anthranilate/para-aminobenzoate synthase component I